VYCIHIVYTLRGHAHERLDDDLLTEAMVSAGLSTEKATVEGALRRLMQRHRRRAALADMTGSGFRPSGFTIQPILACSRAHCWPDAVQSFQPQHAR
jgi:Arc/MetJ family transcription regulator